MNVDAIKLPPGWSWKTMGEIADVVGGGTPKTKDPTNFEGGTIPWLTPADLSGYADKHIGRGARSITQKGLDGSSAKLMTAGTVLFTSRAPIGYVAIASTPVSTNQGFKSFVLKDGVLPDYVYWWLRGSKALAESLASGTTFLELSGAKAKQLPIPIAPIDQQAQIVGEIEKQFSRLDEAVTNLHRVKANLKRYKAAVLKAAVEGRLVETEAELARREGRTYETGEQLMSRISRRGRGEYRQALSPETLPSPKLPEGWIWTTVDHTACVDVGFAFKSREFAAKGVRLLRGDNIEPGALRWTNTRYWPIERVEDHRALLVEEGDIILAMDRPIVSTGLKLARANSDDVPCLLVQRVARLRCATKVVENYLHIALQSEQFQRHLLGGQTGTQLPHISGSRIKSFCLPIPPVDEMQRIIPEVDRQLSHVCDIEELADLSLRRAETMRNELLSQAYTGCGTRSDNSTAKREYCE